MTQMVCKKFRGGICFLFHFVQGDLYKFSFVSCLIFIPQRSMVTQLLNAIKLMTLPAPPKESSRYLLQFLNIVNSRGVTVR